MAVRRYEISLHVLKKYFMNERSEQVNIFQHKKRNFRISKQSCNVLFII